MVEQKSYYDLDREKNIAHNEKYNATIHRMAMSMATAYWKELEPGEYKEAWLRFTKEYWTQMAVTAYMAEHHQNNNQRPKLIEVSQ